MKYISTLIFAIALACTWNLAQEEAPINFETHASIQLKLVEVIRQSVLEIKPQAQSIEILNVSTEPLNDQSLKAYFTYKFQEPDAETGDLVEQQIQGEAQLRRTSEKEAKEEHWVMENVTTQTGTMTFKNGILITPGSNDADEPSLPNQPLVDPAAPSPPSSSAPSESSPVQEPASSHE